MTAPILDPATMQKYHSGTFWSRRRTGSPAFTPRPRRTFPSRSEIRLTSQKVYLAQTPLASS